MKEKNENQTTEIVNSQFVINISNSLLMILYAFPIVFERARNSLLI